jgi:hypothetical protein
VSTRENSAMASHAVVEESEVTTYVDTRSVSSDYVHHERLITSGIRIQLPQADLKWYDIHRPEIVIPSALSSESRDFLLKEANGGRLSVQNELGFVMLHLGDEGASRNTLAMLFVCTWRGNNELWRSLFTKRLHRDERYLLYDAVGHVGTFCVWELGAVLHERDVWNRFLCSSRDEEARLAYLDDTFEGLV